MSPFIRPRPVDDPPVRLVVFHHAGGSAAAYYPFVHGLPPDWDLVLIDLPGRGRRHRSPALTDMTALVDLGTQDVVSLAGAPVALFGHSLGAVVAAEVTRCLPALGVSPVWLGVSGRPGPDEGARYGLPSSVSDGQLLHALRDAGGLPDRLDEVPQFRERLLRVIRCDLRAVESYRPDPGRQPLAVPVTAFAGASDQLAPPPAVAAWARETRAGFRMRVFSGGHFYFADSAFAGLAAALTHEIERALRSVRSPGPTMSPARA
jgi:medium-chain acyl-[acyl-carrier-protein] hydrolase